MSDDDRRKRQVSWASSLAKSAWTMVITKAAFRTAPYTVSKFNCGWLCVAAARFGAPASWRKHQTAGLRTNDVAFARIASAVLTQLCENAGIYCDAKRCRRRKATAGSMPVSAATRDLSEPIRLLLTGTT